jgi:hypothetical protein
MRTPIRVRVSMMIGVLVGVVCASAAAGQAVTGRITDDIAMQPLRLADVQLLFPDGKTVVSTASDSAGFYRLDAPGPGDYRVQVDLIGYKKLQSPLLALGEGGLVNADFELPMDPIELEGLRVETERQEHIKRVLRSYGVRAEGIGERFVDQATIARRPNALDFGKVLQWQSIPGMSVRRSDDLPGGLAKPIICVQLTPGQSRCALTVLNGARISLETAYDIPADALGAIVVLEPTEATLLYGTDGGGGAVLLFTKTYR